MGQQAKMEGERKEIPLPFLFFGVIFQNHFQIVLKRFQFWVKTNHHKNKVQQLQCIINYLTLYLVLKFPKIISFSYIQCSQKYITN